MSRLLIMAKAVKGSHKVDDEAGLHMPLLTLHHVCTLIQHQYMACPMRTSCTACNKHGLVMQVRQAWQDQDLKLALDLIGHRAERHRLPCRCA